MLSDSLVAAAQDINIAAKTSDIVVDQAPPSSNMEIDEDDAAQVIKRLESGDGAAPPIKPSNGMNDESDVVTPPIKPASGGEDKSDTTVPSTKPAGGKEDKSDESELSSVPEDDSQPPTSPKSVFIMDSQTNKVRKVFTLSQLGEQIK